MSETLRDKTQWMVGVNVIKEYLTVCKEAAENEEVFKVFKQDERYTAILEHVSKSIANSYLEIIKENNPWLLENKGVWGNDLYGNAQLEDFGGIKSSPSTIQYIGVLSNLVDEFGSLDKFNIIEIGGGYGGQCKIINDVFKSSAYNIIDLYEPSLLQKKYLSLFKLDHLATHLDRNYVKPEQYDLVISNYALCEVLEPLQTEYVENILLNSKRGYITCNAPIFSIELLKKKFSTLKILKDIKGELDTNYIIVW